MRTYVTSLHAGASVSHVGNAHWTACGYIFVRCYKVTDLPPPGYGLCRRCIHTIPDGLAEVAGIASHYDYLQEQLVVAEMREAWQQHVREHGFALRIDSRDREFVLLLARGATNRDISAARSLAPRLPPRPPRDARPRAGRAPARHLSHSSMGRRSRASYVRRGAGTTGCAA